LKKQEDEMASNRRSRIVAILQALLVTFLWSTSFVLIKTGLEDIPALTFAGLRYTLAFLCLLPLALRPTSIRSLRRLSGRMWGQLILLGILYYAVTQGTQFLGLAYLPAITVSMLLSFTPIIVALLGKGLLSERPSAVQWVGVLLNVSGIMIYLYPIAIPLGEVVGLAIVIVGVFANALSSIIGRRVNRDGEVLPVAVTTVSMGVGALILLATGIMTQGLPSLGLTSWLIIVWLAVINTAFAFSLWNHTLRTLSAMESTIINGTMLIQIAVLAWLFLGERMDWLEIVGLIITGVGALMAQIRGSRDT